MYKKRILYKKGEKENIIEKILFNQNIIKIKLGEKRETKRTSITLIRNECIFTGRKRGILKNYRMSRLELKKLYNRGEIAGLKKSTW